MASSEIMSDYLSWTISLLTATDPTDPSTRVWKGGSSTGWCTSAATVPAVKQWEKDNKTISVCLAQNVWRDSDKLLFNLMLGGPGDQTVSGDRVYPNDNTKTKTTTTTLINSVCPGTYKDGKGDDSTNVTPNCGDTLFNGTGLFILTPKTGGNLKPFQCFLQVIEATAGDDDDDVWWLQTKSKAATCSSFTDKNTCTSNPSCRWTDKCEKQTYTCQLRSVESFTDPKGDPKGAPKGDPTSPAQCKGISDATKCASTVIDGSYCNWNKGTCESPTEYPCLYCQSSTKDSCSAKNIKGVPVNCQWNATTSECAPSPWLCGCKPSNKVKNESDGVYDDLDKCVRYCSNPNSPMKNTLRGLNVTPQTTISLPTDGTAPKRHPLPAPFNIFLMEPTPGDSGLFFISSEPTPTLYELSLNPDYSRFEQWNQFCAPAWEPRGSRIKPTTKPGTGLCTSGVYSLEHLIMRSSSLNCSDFPGGTNVSPDTHSACPQPVYLKDRCPTCPAVEGYSNCSIGKAPSATDSGSVSCTDWKKGSNTFVPFHYFLMNSPKWLNRCCNFNSETDNNPTLKFFCTDPLYTLDPNSQAPRKGCDIRMQQLCDEDDPNMVANKGIDACSCLQRPDPKIMDTTVYKYLSNVLKVPDTCLTGACAPEISYVPGNLRRQECPNICSSILNVNSDGFANVEIDGVHMAVHCDERTGTISLSSESPTLAAKSLEKNSSKSSHKWLLYVLLITILLLLVLLIFL